jgi:predicted RNA-binding Zn-ribbon protein involved in translation (DUF1610 family)
MPEVHKKPKWKLRPDFGLQRAAELGNLLVLRCRRCRRTSYFLPADLVEVYGDMEVDDFRLPCSKCGTSEMVRVEELRTPKPGDYGSLDIRRPGPVKHIQTWRTVKLGDA